MNPYLQKQAFCEKQITEAPLPGLGMVIVIPCHNEPQLLKTLNSLAACTLPKCNVEVIVVINAAENSSKEILKENTFTEVELERWIIKNESAALRYFYITNNALPAKDAGVGLARKIGMDEAVRRFYACGNENGVIVCLDSDCTVENNYLSSLEHHFLLHPETTGCSVYFEHPLEGTEFVPQVYEGIIRYELFLRYYNCGLRFSGYPFAWHTIGSSMAVRTKIYQQQGGMNKRKAGEDFYFLTKLFPLGGFTELNDTTVFPSPRPSERVPFGTGKAINKWLQEGTNNLPTYHPKTFTDLAELVQLVPELYTAPVDTIRLKIQHLSPALLAFLADNELENKLTEINGNVKSKEQFVNRFYRWFGNFMVLKFVHFARDNYYGQQSIETAAKALLENAGIEFSETITAKELLLLYRELERNNKAVPQIGGTALV
jgi:glycosyltransferase involved in cell wall biosynthesis